MVVRPLSIVWTVAVVAAANAQTLRPTSLPATRPIPRDQLDQLDRSELGQLYKSSDAPKLSRAHELIERYLDEPAGRREIVRSLEALSLDPNIIGRLTRIRTTWPQLPAGIYHIDEKMGPHAVRYYLGIPKGYDRQKSSPLVVKLAEPDAFTTDPPPDPAQVTQLYMGWMAEELARHPDAVLIMPVLNLDELWGPSYAGMNNVIQPIHHATTRVNIDPARIYIVGAGTSAGDAWNFALHYPTYFAAFNALGGAVTQEWQKIRLVNLRNVLPVIWQDTDDEAAPVGPTRQLINALRNQRYTIEYQETRGVGHTPTAEIVERSYQKMRGQVRPIYPKQVSLQSNRPDTLFNRNDWLQIYQSATEGQERRIFFPRVPGYMIILPSTFMLDATISNNTITISSRNVQSLRFYLNDQMIDFSKDVSVINNRRTIFQAVPKPGIEQTLKDQLFLGRGFRYYTAVIDIDLAPAAAGPAAGATSRPSPASPRGGEAR